jgi:predicted MFS family arabinose efflux permease
MSGLSVGQLVMMAALTLVLAAIGWRSVFLWVALAHLVVVLFLWAALPRENRGEHAAARPSGMELGTALRTGRFWVLAGIYAICGMDDFFVTTHVVAFAQDKGIGAVLAGNLLALMGLAALAGVLLAGACSDRFGAVATTAVTFALRVAVFGLILFDQSHASIVVYALVFGATFLVTAPMTVLFVRDCFGTRHLGALTGLITMVHQIFAGVGAYGGALVFDRTGAYDAAFVVMLVASAAALGLTFMVRPPRPIGS